MVTKLRLKKAIILEDARRIDEGETTINNIRRLTLLMVEKHPKKYTFDNLNVWLYKLNSKGITKRDRTYVMDFIIEDLCELLRIEKDELVNEIECW